MNLTLPSFFYFEAGRGQRQQITPNEKQVETILPAEQPILDVLLVGFGDLVDVDGVVEIRAVRRVGKEEARYLVELEESAPPFVF